MIKVYFFYKKKKYKVSVKLGLRPNSHPKKQVQREKNRQTLTRNSLISLIINVRLFALATQHLI